MTRFRILSALAIGLSLPYGAPLAADQISAATRQDLGDAMHGEAFAYLKYLAYADHARRDGNLALAKLFEQTAETERREHFAEHARIAGLVGSDEDNLRDAIAGENQESADMYPAMARRARRSGDAETARHFDEVGKDEARHRDAFKDALVKLVRIANRHEPRNE